MNDEQKIAGRGVYGLVLCALTVAGCTSGDAGADNGVSTHSQPLREGKIDRVEQADGRPTAVITTDGRRVAFENGEATVGDMMVIATTGGDVEYHRTPSSIMSELSRTQVAYRVEGTDELVYFAGLEGNPRVDADSGKLCWMAVSCKNNDCTSTSSFSFQEPGYSTNDDGSVIRPDPGTVRRPSTTPPCPHCGSRDFLEPYRPAEVAELRQRLEAELAASRDARARRSP